MRNFGMESFGLTVIFKHGDEHEHIIGNCVQNQGKIYQEPHLAYQLAFFKKNIPVCLLF